VLGTAFLAAVTSALFIWAAFSMYTDVFPFGETAEGKAFIWYLLLGILLLLGWNEAMRYLGKRKLRLGGNLGVLAVLAAILWFSYRGVAEELSSGIGAVAADYIRYWNIHFGANLTIPAGDSEYKRLAVEFLIVVAVYLIQLCSALFRKRVIMLLLPASVLSMELLVGYASAWPGLAVMFVGLLFALFLDSNPVFEWKRAGVLAAIGIILVLVSGKVFSGVADKVYEYHDVLIQFQKKLEASIRDFDLKRWATDIVDFGADNVIDNSKPQYKEKEVLKLTMSEIPNGTVYLRGYHCTDYVDGCWKQEYGDFEDICAELDLSEEQGAQRLMQLRYNAAQAYLNKDVIYDIQYTDLRSIYVYLPYGVKPDEKSYSLQADYVAKKGIGKDRIIGRGWKQPNYGAAVGSNKGLFTYDQQLFDAYNAYALERYLEVPDHMERVKATADYIRRNNTEEMGMLRATVDRATNVNKARMNLAEKVAQRIKGLATYSMDLDELPKGEDAIEYFLITGKKGYCIHFASAGALILRELGIPARYVYGYVAKSDSLQKSGEGYTASVLDSYAHAWVEIYLDNYGWVPVEMTPGYSQMVFSESEVTPEPEKMPEDAEETEEPSQESTEADEETTEEEPEKSSEELNEDREPESSEETDDAEDTGEADGNMSGIGTNTGQSGSHGNGVSDGTGGTGTGRPGRDDGKMSLAEWFAATVRKALWVLLIAALCLGVVLGIRTGKRRKKQRLLKLISKGRTRTVVKQMNREIYHYLVWKKRKLPRRHTDEAYRERLQEAFPVVGKQAWNRYFDIVRRVTYSREPVTMEEAKECYMVYLDVKGDLKALR